MPPINMFGPVRAQMGMVAVQVDPYKGLSPDEKADRIAKEVESLKERVKKAEQRQADAEMAAALSRGGGHGFA